jgi:predicted transposase YbfD/YdcC
VNTDPQSAVFPEARQFLRSRNQTTLKKAASHPANATSGLTGAKTEPDLTRYFISSLNPNEAAASMAQKIRAHWCCESRHWQRDALWREDACLLRNPNAACALALIRTSLQTLLRRAGQSSLPVVFENVAHDLSLGLAWLMARKLPN